jgi:hypothetical protein
MRNPEWGMRNEIHKGRKQSEAGAGEKWIDNAEK